MKTIRSVRDEAKVTVPEGESGPWVIKRFDVTKQDAERDLMRGLFSSGGRRYTPAGTYTGAYRNGRVIMSDTPDEISDHLQFAWAIKEGNSVLIHGLGIGMAVQMAIQAKAASIDVIEISPDIISLVGPHYEAMAAEAGVELTIVCADSYEWQPPKGKIWDVAWFDIWDTICSDNLEGMATLARRYARRAKWKGYWAKELCQHYRDRYGGLY